MLSATLGAVRGRESGFTLIELLVTVAASTVVIFALSSIMIVVLHQTQRTFTQVDATRQARAAFANIENELHSACVAPDVAPVLPGSDTNTVQFLSYTGAAATTTPQWHVLRLTNGSLWDDTYAATINDDGSYTRASDPTNSRRLLENVAAKGDSAFQYFRYESYPAPNNYQYWNVPDGNNALPDGTLPKADPIVGDDGGALSSAQAANVVEVLIELNVFATSEDLNRPDLSGASDPVTDAISLRLTSPPNEVPADAGAGSYGPCS